ncbi:MAG: DNA-formamidopyrimidine glycosylase [Solobacterium sp.]|nr:DNA-formamidopyrimidine glycosylase [Solobacterium sp.]
MPELPEVETVLRTLEGQIRDAVIRDIDIYLLKMLDRDPDSFRSRLIGQGFRDFRRRGKYLLFVMDDCILVSHLRMEGKYFLYPDGQPPAKHTHVVFHLEDGRALHYNDTRKFGTMEIIEKDTDLAHFHDLGPEPLTDEYTGAYVYAYMHSHERPVKSILLDQNFAAGIGNIYADEILSASRIRPGSSSKRLTHKDCNEIADNTKVILSEAIRAGGTTIRSYTSSLGVTGRFQLSCCVHGMDTCRRCGSRVKIKKIGGRSSYYCPFCSKR